MTRSEFKSLLKACPLIASVQASENSAVDDPQTLLQMAQASLDQGVKILRLQGAENIQVIKQATQATIIGLIKENYSGSEVYITSTLAEVDLLASLGVEVVAFDGTSRPRPGGVTRQEIINRIHFHGILAMADCDTPSSALQCRAEGADCIGTTLSGYTQNSPAQKGPDLEFIRTLCNAQGGFEIVIAEGRYATPLHVSAAKAIGAHGIVIGGAINDPVKQTNQFLAPLREISLNMGAIDLGGTWMRMCKVTPDGELRDIDRIPMKEARGERLKTIENWLKSKQIEAVGISSGGTINPRTNTVIEAKSIIPDFVGTVFEFDNIKTFAINDGHATAFGHAMHPQFAGQRVATLALGTGVGFGFVDRGQILMGHQGEYIRMNDIPADSGRTFEDLLGGAGLSTTPNQSQMDDAQRAADLAVKFINKLYYPDKIVICGGVGLCDWLEVNGTVKSPFGRDAGLFGAAHYLISKLRE